MFQHTSLEANTRTFIRKMEIITFYSSNSEEHANNKKKHTHTQKEKTSHLALSNIFEETMGKFTPCSFRDLIPFFSSMHS